MLTPSFGFVLAFLRSTRTGVCLFRGFVFSQKEYLSPNHILTHTDLTFEHYIQKSRHWRVGKGYHPDTCFWVPFCRRAPGLRLWTILLAKFANREAGKGRRTGVFFIVGETKRRSKNNLQVTRGPFVVFDLDLNPWLIFGFCGKVVGFLWFPFETAKICQSTRCPSNGLSFPSFRRPHRPNLNSG